ncbi:MAG: hypothetical protein U0703_06225 [Anaerolineae bacterium]
MALAQRLTGDLRLHTRVARIEPSEHWRYRVTTDSDGKHSTPTRWC